MTRVVSSFQRTVWVEASESAKCPACGHARYCSISDCGRFCICRRGVESSTPVKQRDGSSAYFHRVEELGNGAVVKRPGLAKRERARLTTVELKLLIKQSQSAISPERLARVAKSLNVSTQALEAYGVGFDSTSGCVAFPMYSGTRKPIGIRLRNDQGRKLCVPGSSNGLFVPKSILERRESDDDRELLLPEGPTDACAAFDLDYRAIGRPSNSGGAFDVSRILLASKKQHVVVVADRDATKWLKDGLPYWPGLEGALALARTIFPVVVSLKILKMPAGTKDLRAWLASGGTTSQLADLIARVDRLDSKALDEQERNLRDAKEKLRREPMTRA